MGLKTLPTHKDWPTVLRAHRIKDDRGFGKALETFWRLPKDECDERLAVLPKLLKLANELAKSKEIAATSPHAPKMFEEIADLIVAKRKEVEQEKKDFAANGARSVDVQMIIVDWNGKPLRDAEGFVAFRSPGVPTVTRKAKLNGGGFDMDDVLLRSSGTVSLTVYPDNKGENIVGSAPYEFKPGSKTVLKFKAVQHMEQHRVRAKSIDEVSRKLGFKGSVGVDWKVVKIGGEVTGEEVDRGVLEQEVEWQVKAGVPTFLDFKQL